MLRICGISDLGCKREDNQDAFLVDGIIEKKEITLILPMDGHYYPHYGMLCAVADGMGGQQGGEVASLIVLESMAGKKYELSKFSQASEASDYLQNSIESIHRLINEQGQLNPELTGMGSTLTGIYMHHNYKLFFHVGDSRLYRFRGDFMMQLTKDHSLESLSEQASGYYQQASKSGVLISSIGGGNSAQCKVDSEEISFIEGDILLLCSDGLSDMVTLESMEGVLKSRNNLFEAAHSMVNAAREAGGSDNISVILIEHCPKPDLMSC